MYTNLTIQMENQDSRVFADMNFGYQSALYSDCLRTRQFIVGIVSEISLSLCQQKRHRNRIVENYTSKLMFQRSKPVALNHFGLNIFFPLLSKILTDTVNLLPG